MKKRIALVLPLLFVPAFAVGKPAAVGAIAQLQGQGGEALGTVTMERAPHGVLLKGSLTGLPPGSHAIHIHEKGVCLSPFTTAGGHFNPMKRKHGLLAAEGMHEGDLPNIVVEADGSAKFEFFLHGALLDEGKKGVFDADGSTIIVHAGPDDYKTDPAGAAGDRIACGVIARR